MRAKRKHTVRLAGKLGGRENVEECPSQTLGAHASQKQTEGEESAERLEACGRKKHAEKGPKDRRKSKLLGMS